MQKSLTASLVAAGLVFALFSGAAQAKTTRVHKKAPRAAATKTQSQNQNHTEAQPVIEGHVSALYQCDLGDRITVYKNAADDSYVNLRWRNKVYHMTREQTSTGANRYESKTDGLVLISIPSKSMLFDARKGRQLANECRSPEQARKLASTK